MIINRYYIYEYLTTRNHRASLVWYIVISCHGRYDGSAGTDQARTPLVCYACTYEKEELSATLQKTIIS